MPLSDKQRILQIDAILTEICKKSRMFESTYPMIAIPKTVLHMHSLKIKNLVKTLLTHTISIYWDVFDVLHDVVVDVTIGQMVISLQITLLVLFCVCTHQYLEF